VLRVRRFARLTSELDPGRSEGYAEYACLTASVIAEAEYRPWAAARITLGGLAAACHRR
jgi:hypothetical protein